MTMRAEPVDQAALQAKYRYDADTGHLLYRDHTAKYMAGDRAGGPTGDGWRVKYNGKTYRLQYLIAMYHGWEIPKRGRVGHRDGDPMNNRIENLILIDYKTQGTGGQPEGQPSLYGAIHVMPEQGLQAKVDAAVAGRLKSLEADVVALKAQVKELLSGQAPAQPVAEPEVQAPEYDTPPW